MLSPGESCRKRILPFLSKKPLLSVSAPERTRAAGGPFQNPRPREVIATYNSSHWLLVNLYCVYRPMLVLPTIKYPSQTDDLDISDITVTWRVLKAFQTTPQMAIYNCGANARSSQGHKHLQIFPISSLMSQTLFPTRATSFENIESNISNVTFEHYVLRIRASDTAKDVFNKYQLLLRESKTVFMQARTENDYNITFTTEWITLIPRRIAILGDAHGANAAGMLGIVAVSSKNERDQWAGLGYTK